MLQIRLMCACCRDEYFIKGEGMCMYKRDYNFAEQNESLHSLLGDNTEMKE